MYTRTLNRFLFKVSVKITGLHITYSGYTVDVSLSQIKYKYNRHGTEDGLKLQKMLSTLKKPVKCESELFNEGSVTIS